MAYQIYAGVRANTIRPDEANQSLEATADFKIHVGVGVRLAYQFP